jgi:hypothetical protein
LSQNGLVAASRAVDQSDTDAARWWRAYCLAEADRIDDLRREAESGNEHAVVQLASRLDEHRRTGEAIAVIRPLAESGHDVAETWLMRWLADNDEIAELRERAADGQYRAVRELADWLVRHKHDNMNELHDLVQSAEGPIRQDLMNWLAASPDMELLELAGDLGDAEARDRYLSWMARRLERARERAARGDDQSGSQ